MGIEELTTRQLIIDAGKKEFLQKGFLGASLRNIAKSANVTTGALYGYFDGKEDLFSTIVKPCCAAVKCRFSRANDSFFELPKKADNKVQPIDCIDWMIDYMYDHYDVFKILICCSDGTKYETFVHDMVEIEVESTLEYINKNYDNSYEIDKNLCHMIASGMFGGIFELIEHDMPREKAKPFVNILREFNHAGWLKLIELK
jgi:AcrR family transcriptional regulator